LDIQSNKLHFGPFAAENYEGVEARCVITGDFDIQVDFDLDQYPSTNSWRLDFSISEQGSGNDWAYAGIEYDAGGRHYIAVVADDGVASYNVTEATSHTSGKLRIVRIGYDFHFYYWTGSAWDEIGSGYTWSGTGWGDGTFNLALNMTAWGSSTTVEGSYDNFTVNSADEITGYLGETGDRAAQQVWDGDFELVYHFDQPPEGDADEILDSTVNAIHGQTVGTGGTALLVDALMGKGVYLEDEDRIEFELGQALVE
ncbi:unnamed protein product, partial [marine sediment metagenome]